MKLLIVTQKVDATDSNLGFFTRWIKEFATQCESVLVICLEQGTYALPQNVRVLSLGKERFKIPMADRFSQARHDSRFKIVRQLRYILRLFRYIVIERGNYDAVFVHMNPEYLLLGGLFWKLLRKRVGFWYTHSSKRFLPSATLFADVVFSASRDSFPLPTKKLRVLGHGIDTNRFVPKEKKAFDTLRLLSVGRISASKRHLFLIQAVAVLKKETKQPILLHIVGEPVTKEDDAYKSRLLHYIEREGLEKEVRLLGGKLYSELPDLYTTYNFLLHASVTGSIDKVVLEAVACDVPVLTTSRVFKNILPEAAVIQTDDPYTFGGAILSYPRNVAGLRERTVKAHNVETVVGKILVHLTS